ncbi:MAG: T9SS type A sorting domain-containing protein [Bacteroidota bacterium]
MKPISDESYLKISPNPANEYITVSYNINGVINGLRLFITDAMGRAVYDKNLNKAKDEQLLIIKDYAKGTYFCTIFNNGKVIKSGKFIKN